MATATARLELSKPESTDLVSAYPAALGPSLDTLDAEMPRLRGAWSNATAYAVKDLVSSAGSMYVATAASTNQAPPNASFWQPFSVIPGSTYTMTHVSDTETRALQIDLPSAGRGPYVISVENPVVGGVRDGVMAIGYNADADGTTRIVDTDPSLSNVFEAHYNTGSANWVEWYIRYVGTAAAGSVVKRPIMLALDKATNSVTQCSLMGNTVNLCNDTVDGTGAGQTGQPMVAISNNLVDVIGRNAGSDNIVNVRADVSASAEVRLGTNGVSGVAGLRTFPGAGSYPRQFLVEMTGAGMVEMNVQASTAGSVLRLSAPAGIQMRRGVQFGGTSTGGTADMPLSEVLAAFAPLASHTGDLTQWKVPGSATTRTAVVAGGTLISDDATKGIILKDAAATPHYWRVTVSTGGALTTTDLGTTRPTS